MHSLVAVFIEEDSEDSVDSAMEPFNENLSVDEWEDECYCIGKIALDECIEKAVSMSGASSLDEAKQRMELEAYSILLEENPQWEKMRVDRSAQEVQDAENLRFPRNIKDVTLAEMKYSLEALGEEEGRRAHAELLEIQRIQVNYREFHMDIMESARAMMDNHPKVDEAYPECEHCDGTGSVMANYSPQGKWDWFQVGGRWAGQWTDYDPEKDPNNIEQCSICSGTGERPNMVLYLKKGEDAPEGAAYDKDVEVDGVEVSRYFLTEASKNCNGCNGCRGTGKSVKWPTDWNSDGNIHRVSDIIERAKNDPPASFITLDGEWVDSNVWDSKNMQSDENEEYIDRWLKELDQNKNLFVAAVDIHS
jgi:hypothetical protein